MKKRTPVHVTGLLLGLCMVTARASDTQTLGVVTLASPNEQIFGGFSGSVSGAGDVNQDGFTDVIVGAPLEAPGTSPIFAGRAYISSGQDGTLLFELMSPNEEAGLIGGAFGASVSGVGDVNHDGFADVIVGAPGEDPGTSPEGAGRAYLFSGQDGSLLFELASANEELVGSFGSSASGAGDVNQDGWLDFIVGAHGESTATQFRAGRAYVFSGQDGSLLFQLMSPNEEIFGNFGVSVSDAGDVNQDGFADVIVGAWLEGPGTSPNAAGRAYVFSGRDGNLLFQLISPNEELTGHFGFSVSGAGDVNQDGLTDVIVGAFREDPGTSPQDAGRAYVFSGQDGSLLFELMSANEEEFGGFGVSVSDAGDVNQDGLADVICGAPNEDRGPSPVDAGRAYVFGGQDGSLLFQLTSPNEEASGGFGVKVSGAGDVNQDGLADVIVGAPGESPGTSPYNAGRAYIFVLGGVQQNLFRINSAGPNYMDTGGRLFVADQAYTTGSFGYVGGIARSFSQPIGGTEDDPLYQDLRLVRDGSFSYRFDVPSAAPYKVTLYLMAPALGGAGNIVMKVQAEGEVIFGQLDVTAEAGGTYRALTRTFSVQVSDGTLDLEFLALNKAAVVSAIAVVQQTNPGAQP